jgi:hypothetical protein
VPERAGYGLFQIKDNQFFLVNLSDEQMKTLQFLYKMNL